MAEISLEELENWYLDSIDDEYSRHKKGLRKLLDKLDGYVIDLRHAIDKMIEREDEVDIDDKSKVFLERFYKKVKDYVDKLEIPENPMADEVRSLIDAIRRLFRKINEAGRKNIPRFAEDFKIELKEIDMITRKISKYMAKIDKFLRKKYSDVRDAEQLIKKFDKLEDLVERIGNAKSTVDDLAAEKESMETELKNLEEKMINIENHPLYEEKDKIEKKLLKLRIDFANKIKFKKVLKRLKKVVSDSGGYKNISADEIRKYMSNPIRVISKEGPEHHDLTEFLVQVRYMLEQERGTLHIKKDTMEKTLENIDEIVSDGILKQDIEDYNEYTGRIKEINDELEKKDLSTQLEDLKQKTSLKTQKLEHLKADLAHKGNEYRGLLEKLKVSRDAIQDAIREYVDQDVKINITLTY